MKVGQIIHYRCGDYRAVTFIGIPDDWSDDDFQKAVRSARDAYLVQAEKVDPQPPNDYRMYSHPPYDKYPDRTVKEVREEHEKKKVEYERWYNEQRKTKKKLAEFLEDEGLIPMYKADFEHEAEMDWGHRHGMTIDYSETKSDESITPYEMVTGENPFSEF